MSNPEIDKKAAAAVHLAINELQTAMMIARREGLTVDLTVVEQNSAYGSRSFVTAKVSREIE